MRGWKPSWEVRSYHHVEYFIQLCFFSSFISVFESNIVPLVITDHLTELVSISDALTPLAGSCRGKVPAASLGETCPLGASQQLCADILRWRWTDTNSMAGSVLNNPSPAPTSRRLGGIVTPSENVVLPPLLSLLILSGSGEQANCPLAAYVTTDVPQDWQMEQCSLVFLKEALKEQHHIQIFEPGFSGASSWALYPPWCMERKTRSLWTWL